MLEDQQPKRKTPTTLKIRKVVAIFPKDHQENETKIIAEIPVSLQTEPKTSF